MTKKIWSYKVHTAPFFLNYVPYKIVIDDIDSIDQKSFRYEIDIKLAIFWLHLVIEVNVHLPLCKKK